MEKNKKKLPIGIKIILSGIIIAIFLIISASFFVFGITKNLPSPKDFSVKNINQSTKIYDREGKILLYEVHGEEKRTIISFKEIPDVVKKATLAAEDVDFYNQPAFDWKSIIRAFFANLNAGKIVQGGSTITQQLAKNIFLTREKTMIRKLKELILAVQLESKYSKDEIFYFYLNQIPYGSNAYGIEAASQTFFGKSAKDLEIQEAALLASLANAPSYYSPYGSHVSELLDRKNYVLDQMVKTGFISQKEADETKKKEIIIQPQSIGNIKAPHFSLMIKQYLEEKYGEIELKQKGYKVITTLDWKLQELAEKTVKEGAQNNEKLYKGRNASLVAEDPKTGQILALVGSRDYFDDSIKGNFNIAVQGLRQPGSALKPFIYLTAFEKGYTPNTLLFDSKTEFDTRGGNESYSPENFDGIFRGPVDMKNSLAQSLNIPAVKTLYLVGVENALNTLHAFGITTLNDQDRYSLTLVLGGGEVKLIDLVNAYATLARGGVFKKQNFILKIEDSDGEIIEEYKEEEGVRIMQQENPYRISRILSDKSLRSSLFQNSLPLTVFPGYEVSLKTGTSQDYRDAWAFGYTPSLTVGVWAGNTDNTPMEKQGGSILAAIPMWSNFLREALKNYPQESFTQNISLDEQINKPMLNGNYVWMNNGIPEIHSILYYVNKNDPRGSWPQNPANDPQFKGWEEGVQKWLQENNIGNKIVDYTKKQETNNKEVTPISLPIIGDEIRISIINPKNNETKQSPFTINATIESGEDLKRIDLIQNGITKNSINISGKKFDYQYYFYGKLEKENVFEIKATNTNNKIEIKKIIIKN